MSNVFWFRNDLRLADNPGLVKATEEGVCIAAIYVVCAAMFKRHSTAETRVHFIKKHLQLLETELRKINIPLVILSADKMSEIPGVVARFLLQSRAGSLYFNAEYPVHEFDRDRKTADLARAENIRVVRCHDRVIIPPGMIRNGKGEPYKIFTPFKKNWIEQVKQLSLQPLGRPKKQKLLGAYVGFDSIESAFSQIPQRDLSKIWPPGEKTAQKLLQQFIECHIIDYKAERDVPALDTTSKLSPYLAIGSISVRQCLWAAIQANRGELDSGNESIKCWISELVWREFYQHVMVDYPEVCKHKPMQAKTDNFPWKYNEHYFLAWTRGETGVPIIDAAMRQLRQTGWMHNRLRMVVAMYFTKNLQLDWRLGEDYFMSQLIDGDFAANNGGWQWCASTGTDAAPYFRIFNPISQSQKFDPEGIFIREYVPELKNVASKYIHNPPAATGYCAPLVDLSLTRKQTIELFSKL